jgi:glutamate transport system substrate-binding protein
MRVIAAAVLSAMLLAGGCGGGDGRPAESIIDKETLVVGVRPDLPAVGLRDANGDFAGLDVDVARYVVGKLGADVEFVSALAADREPLLLSGRADLIFATYSITPERKTRVAFAGPYLLSYQDILVPSDERDIRTVRDLAGRSFCAVRGSNAPDRVIKERGVAATVVTAADYGECMTKLRDGTVDAIATNDVILAGLAARAGGGLRLLNTRYSSERTGVGMRKGDVAGCEAVNRAITAMYQDGTARRLMDKWFGGSGLDLSGVDVPQFEGCT